jgi:cell division protein FtsB
MMLSQEMINFLAGSAFAVLGWFARVLWVAVRDLEKDLGKLREELPQTYLPKHDARELIGDLTNEMRDSFNRLFSLIDKKQDK